MIALDFETIGLEPERGKLRLVQVTTKKGTCVHDAWDPEVDLDRLLALLATKQMVAHNANFEEAWFRKHGFEVHLDDTLVMSRVLYGGTAGHETLRHSLEAVAERELSVELDKEQQTSNWAAPVLSEEQLEYAKREAEITLALYEVLRERLENAGLWKVYQLENRVRPAVDAMERRGVAIHRDRLETLIEEATERAEALKAELEAEWDINPGSGKQLIEHFKLEGRQGWPKTNGGKPKTDQEAMKRLLKEEPSVAKWVEWKEIEKIRSTYGTSILSKLDEDGRLRARFNAFGTATGCFSSSNPNLQNIPKRGTLGPRMRGLFWSGSDDRVLIKADYASIELWVAPVLWDAPHMHNVPQQGV
jgi:DNA polymerase-1